MKTRFVIVNDTNHVLSKQGEWLELSKLKHAFSALEKDVVLNELIERNQKHVDERLFVRECSLDEKGRPQTLLTERVPTE